MNDNDTANKKRASTSRSKPTSSFKIEPLKCESSYEEEFNMDMIHLFELYGIDLSKVSILRINDFPDPNECERYLKEHHLGENKNIKVLIYTGFKSMSYKLQLIKDKTNKS